MKKTLLLTVVSLFAIVGTATAKDYGFKIAGVSVTSSNCNNVTGSQIKSGTVKYDESTNTVTLTGVTISRDGSGNRAILNTGCTGLKVVFKGTNNLSAADAAPVRIEKNTSISCESGGTATITGGSEDVICVYNSSTKLTISDANLTLKATNSEVFDGDGKASLSIDSSPITASSSSSVIFQNIATLSVNKSTLTLTTPSSKVIGQKLGTLSLGKEMNSMPYEIYLDSSGDIR